VQIIVVDPRLKRAVTLRLTRWFWLAASALLLAVALGGGGLFAAAFKAAYDIKLPIVHEIAAALMRDEVERNEQYMRDNVNAMALRLGEMQAQLMRLDALGDRLTRLSGVRIDGLELTRGAPGRGGADTGGRPLSLDELKIELQRVARGVDRRADLMGEMETELIAARARRTLLPENTPVPEGFVGSGYGQRTDPFTGKLAQHDGVDFAAPKGTPIFAAAGGVVSAVEFNSSYGNNVMIDHDTHLSTLYAHASRILVKTGDIVRKGQKIAEVGNTGRATGPHLHFEVHVDKQPRNPAQFLAANAADAADTVALASRAKPAPAATRKKK
jgi:murein DD-endopeptidase MepM/ murein hydrolase activator NlpD